MLNKEEMPKLDLSVEQEKYKAQLQEVIQTIKANDKSGVRSNKLKCEVWLLDSNGKRDKYLGGKKVKIGKKEFTVKIGGVPMQFKINYGELKEHEKYLLYQVDINNSVGAISYHPYEKEKAYPNQVAIMLSDFAVKTFHKKGGMPFWYLLIPLIIAGIMGISLAIITPDYINSKDLAEEAIDLYNKEHNENILLKQQLSSMENR